MTVPHWYLAIAPYLTATELAVFTKLPVSVQKEFCHAVVLKMLPFTRTGIRKRGGDPETDFRRGQAFNEGSQFARRMIDALAREGGHR